MDKDKFLYNYVLRIKSGFAYYFDENGIWQAMPIQEAVDRKLKNLDKIIDKYIVLDILLLMVFQV